MGSKILFIEDELSNINGTILDALLESKFISEKEYNDFLLSEFILEKMEEENLSVRALAKKADVSPTIIQKLRKSETAEKINYGTFIAVINSLGYKLNLVHK